MTIADSFHSLFQSAAERNKVLKRKQQRSIRKMEQVVEVFDEMAARQEENSKKAWNDAREALRTGNRAKAQICLQKYRSYQSRLYGFQRKKFVFENYTDKLREMIENNEINAALSVVNRLINVDMEGILANVEGVDEKLSECDELGREWDRKFGAEIRSRNHMDADYIPEMDTIMSQLEMEAAGGIVNPAGGGITNPDIARISAELGGLK